MQETRPGLCNTFCIAYARIFILSSSTSRYRQWPQAPPWNYQLKRYVILSPKCTKLVPYRWTTHLALCINLWSMIHKGKKKKSLFLWKSVETGVVFFYIYHKSRSESYCILCLSYGICIKNLFHFIFHTITSTCFLRNKSFPRLLINCNQNALFKWTFSIFIV